MKSNHKDKSLAKKVLLSVVAAGVMSTCVMGSALAVDVKGNNVNREYGEFIYSDSTFENVMNNTATAGNQKDGLAGGGMYISYGNKVTNVTFNNSMISGNKLLSNGGGANSEVFGGAIAVKGSKVIFNDVSISNNIAEVQDEQLAVGGAITADAKINKGVNEQSHLTFNNTKDLKYVGNTVKSQDGYNTWYDTYGGLTTSGGGFLFIDRSTDVTFNVTNGSTLTIGEAGAADVNADTIASSLIHSPDIKTAYIKKDGDGTLTINSSLDKYYGTLEIAAGTVNLTRDLNLRNNYNITGGTLNLGNVTLNKLSGTIKDATVNNNGTFSLVAKTGYDVNQTKKYTLTDNVGSITTAKGSTLTAKTVCVNAGSINAEGTVNASAVYANNGTSVVLNGGGEITGDEWHNAAIVKDKSTLTATKVNFTGDFKAKEGSKIILNGGSVTASDYYDKAGKKDGYTEFGAIDANSSIEADGVDIKSATLAKNGANVTIKNSSINTVEGIWAWSEESAGKGSVIVLDGTAANVYTVGESIVAYNGGKIYINGGTLKDDNLKSKMFGIEVEGGTINTDTKGIVLDKNGVISTMSKQIFEHAANAKTEAVGEITNNGIDFQGGTLSLNDAEYTLAYANDAGSKVGPTNVVMTGKLAGSADGKVSVGAASKVGDKVALDQVTATTTEKNLLVGSTSGRATNVDGIEVKEKVQNGFSVGSLELAAGSTGVVITNAENVTLGGSAGGDVISVVGESNPSVKVVVGTTDLVAGTNSKAGSLTIGNALATADTKYTLKGEVVVNENSKLNVNGQTTITNGVTLNGGEVKVDNGALKTAELEAKADTKLTGEVNAGKLTGADSKTLAIGDKDNAGKLTVKEATLNGGMLFLDPAFKNGATIGDASGVAVTTISNLDGAYVAGQNSKLSFGADLAAADAVFAKTGETWGKTGVTAAAYIAKSVSLVPATATATANGSLTVKGDLTTANIGSYTPTAGSVTFAENSLLMVNGAEITSTAAITDVTRATVDASSKLYIDNAKKGEIYKVLAGAGIAGGWDEAKIISSNSLLRFTKDTDANKYDVKASVKFVKDAFGGEVIAPKAYDAALNAADANAASDFIMNAADSKVNATKAAQVSALNSAAAMGELAGVEHGTYAASNLLTDAVTDHMSLANDKDHDSDIWAKYIHTKEDIDGLSVANFGADYDAQYNGIVVGADLYKNGKATVGAALTYVDGNINGNTLAARTKNDATYYGASIYGGIQNEDSAVVGDISYLHGKNDITQYNSGATLTADAKSDAFSIGVRAEKSVKAGVGKFVPYAGIRYMHLGAGNYTNSIGMAYDGDDMNLWLLPVGVKYSADVKAGGWTIRPIAEVGYVWNMGDRDATQTVSLNGASDGFGYDVTDNGSYIGRFVVEAEKANVTYGLGYEYQKGDSVKANKWMANVNWSF